MTTQREMQLIEHCGNYALYWNPQRKKCWEVWRMAKESPLARVESFAERGMAETLVRHLAEPPADCS